MVHLLLRLIYGDKSDFKKFERERERENCGELKIENDEKHRDSTPNRAQSLIIRHELSSADVLTRVAMRPMSGGQATLRVKRVGGIGCAGRRRRTN